MHKQIAIILLENPVQHKCMIRLDREWYVHVKIVIIVPREMPVRKFHGHK